MDVREIARGELHGQHGASPLPFTASFNWAARRRYGVVLAMNPEEEVFDSPTGWVARHVRSYVETDGRKGHRWSGVKTLLLTTRGRRSGKLRRTALIYGEDGDRYLVVASKGGAKKHPSWYVNLVEHPEVQLQVGGERFPAQARTASPEEKPRLWRLMTSIWPEYDRYQARTDREIPVVILERLSADQHREGAS